VSPRGTAVPNRPTPGWMPVAGPHLLRTAVLLLLLAAGSVATAGPAAAAHDPSQPQASVTRGPSCEPGGVEITIVAGTVPYHVVLATTRHPDGEDAADVAAGATVLLHSGDVDWGETIDSRLLYSALDGSGATSTDELEDWTMTRPSYHDCAAIPAPAPASAPAAGTAAGSPASGTTASAGPSGTAAPDTGTAPTSPGSGPSSGGPVVAPPAPPADGSGAAGGPSAVVSAGAAGADGAASRAVGAGRPITVSGAGFQPGEDVVLRLRDTGAVLASGTAGPDGAVHLSLTVPAQASGSTQFDLVGRTSRASAPLRLEVAAMTTGVADGGHPFSLPPLAALVALLTTGGGLVAVTRRAAATRGTAAMGGA
jgi:hypothetical protein